MPSNLLKDSTLRTMIDGVEEFEILKDVRNRTIYSVVAEICYKSDIHPYAATQYANTLIKKVSDIKV